MFSKRCYRRLRLERLEPRLVMSAGSLLPHSPTLEAPALASQQTYAEAAPGSLAATHAATGLSHVRSNYGFEGGGQTIAVIDTGIAWDHPSLGGGFGAGFRVVGGYDFADDDNNPYDDGPAGAHGTHVAGILGAREATRSGVAPGVDLVAVRVFDDLGGASFDDVEKALQWVHDHRLAFANPITTVNLSLGSNWNSDAVPHWATLEDEFQQLENDGIFISVAAGNAFESFDQSGLSYPAASQYVVPVSSVDASGSLSSFTQRHQRAIAAPGENIFSTVPDYVGNFNGRADDWAAFSGTSMAAPYVSAASALVREAMQFVGMTGISQDDINRHLRATADAIFDPVTTANYLRLDVGQAIDALMPADDHGSTPGSGTQLDLAGSKTIEGVIQQLGDVDYFSFTADQSGTLTLAASGTHKMVAQWLTGPDAEISGGATHTMQLAAGQSYEVGIHSGDGIGYYTIDVQFQAAPAEPPIELHDLGRVDFAALTDRFAATDGVWFRLEAAHDALLTAEAFGAGGEAFRVELYNEQFEQLAAGSARADFDVSASDVVLVKISGSATQFDLRLTNLVQQADNSLTVLGTAGDDRLDVDLGSPRQLTVNGVEYAFPGSPIQSVRFDGAGGEDSLTARLGAGNDRAVFAPGSLDIGGGEIDVVVKNVESIEVDAAGGVNHAIVHDSQGDDEFRARKGWAAMSSTGYSHVLVGFADVLAIATHGDDRALLFDTDGSDVYRAAPGTASMSGTGYQHTARDFDRVWGFASLGVDRALLFDSAGDDILHAEPGRAYMDGGGGYRQARGFDRLYAYSSGGNDRAVLFGTRGADVLTSGNSWSQLSGSGYSLYTSQFAHVDVYALGGVDRAQWIDTAGATYAAWNRQIHYQKSGYSSYAVGFEQIVLPADRAGAPNNEPASSAHDSGDDVPRPRALSRHDSASGGSDRNPGTIATLLASWATGSGSPSASDTDPTPSTEDIDAAFALFDLDD